MSSSIIHKIWLKGSSDRDENSESSTTTQHRDSRVRILLDRDLVRHNNKQAKEKGSESPEGIFRHLEQHLRRSVANTSTLRGRPLTGRYFHMCYIAACFTTAMTEELDIDRYHTTHEVLSANMGY